MHRFMFIILILSTFLLGASPIDSGTWFKGKVIFNDFEAGFWAIVTDEGKKLDGDIPKRLKVKGLRVGGLYQVKQNSSSFHMWGQPVNFIKINVDI